MPQQFFQRAARIRQFGFLRRVLEGGQPGMAHGVRADGDQSVRRELRAFPRSQRPDVRTRAGRAAAGLLANPLHPGEDGIRRQAAHGVMKNSKCVLARHAWIKTHPHFLRHFLPPGGLGLGFPDDTLQIIPPEFMLAVQISGGDKNGGGDFPAFQGGQRAGKDTGISIVESYSDRFSGKRSVCQTFH